jgi:hypothetical protein
MVLDFFLSNNPTFPYPISIIPNFTGQFKTTLPLTLSKYTFLDNRNGNLTALLKGKYLKLKYIVLKLI